LKNQLQIFVVQELRKFIVDMASVWPAEISIVCGLWIQLFLSQSPKSF